jgi:hypothetical protein
MADAKAWVLPIVLGTLAAFGAYGLDQLPKGAAPAEGSHPTTAPVAFVGPAFGGNVTTAQLTLWVYKLDSGGTLLASNTPASIDPSAKRDGDYQELPRPLIVALGNGTLPPGGVRLPPSLASFQAPILANLTGRHVGETIHVHVEHYPWLDIFGQGRIPEPS